MGVLSDDVVKEFAKVTNDTPDTKPADTYMYGTVHIVNGVTMVQFDGSELMTPCTTVVEVKEDDRVMVLVKSRSAVITSNLTTPSIHYTIGGLTITQDSINWTGRFGSSDYEAGIYNNQGHTDDKYLNISVGGTNVTYLRYDGYFFANNAHIKGYVEATDGKFSGELVAATGKIGGFTLSSTSISWSQTISGHTYLAGLYKGNNSSTDKFMSVKVDNSDVTYLRYDGYLYAKNAEIEGTIRAKAGYIKGSVVIGGTENNANPTVGGLTVTGDSIYWTQTISGTNYTSGIYKGSAATSNFLRVQAAGDTKFAVTYGGKLTTKDITATGGTVGGFNISTSSISWTNTIDNKNYISGLYKGNNALTDHFWEVKANNSNVAYLTYGGLLYCQNVEVTGKIKTSSGSEIGGMATDTDKVGWASGNTWGYIRKYASSSTKFIDVQVNGTPQTYLTYGGKFYSQNVEVKGDITATNLTIYDTLYISSSDYPQMNMGILSVQYSQGTDPGGHRIVIGEVRIAERISEISICTPYIWWGYPGIEYGNVYIGATTYIRPGLNVTGTIDATDNITGGNIISNYDVVYTNDCYKSSDIRLKKNVKDVSFNALDIIDQMRIRSFDWKNTGAHECAGFIADEVEEIAPELVTGGGYLENGNINYKKLVVDRINTYLFKAVQELSQKVKDLERRLNNG